MKGVCGIVGCYKDQVFMARADLMLRQLQMPLCQGHGEQALMLSRAGACLCVMLDAGDE